MKTHHVVISGAGPNGLMLACELALAGITPVVLDALPGPSDEPKANGLVGQVVRMLDMRGLFGPLTGSTEPPQPAAAWMFSGMSLDLTGRADNPMRAMLMPQPRLVRFLAQRALNLGVDLRWGHELSGLQPGHDDVAIAVAGPGGGYTLNARYLVGADGGRSLVRKSTGIGFAGTTSNTVARLAHVHVPPESKAEDGSLLVPGFGRIAFGHNRFDNGMVIFAPFQPGDPLLGTLEYGQAGEQGPMSIPELRASLHRVLGVDVPIEAPHGPGPHALRRINGQNTRQAERYRAGRVLLLGDAAHVHSAMGGPGLNLGLQDAVNLGWKLAADTNGWAPPGLLDTYEAERHPVGQRVMMHSLAQIALMAPGPEIGSLRTLFGELMNIPDVVDYFANLLAGSDVRYATGDDHTLSGHLVPDLTLDDGRRVADMLHRARPVLLDLGGGAAADAARGWTQRVDVVTGRLTGGPDAILIRPDGYVAWATDQFAAGDDTNLAVALERWFGAAA
ncbi:FAD-dependent monooxygenase [Mycobacterium sp. DL592]|uniref:FAD-dependent monooxygenase n=1 Tax=Mycobacterium sp. DL592 TaxID=2675524 RepID=UPI00141FDA64|nr:FAD-dependent monooxygenase [Mycobacterium sp. DL592]